ncbi:acyl-CoA dehydrogenase family protein [Paracoccus benzoatiresistens]|uniref:Acyl-CoA dehydrogenase family protein n=1 Tax=Paracoccus benzoatiresistens TaxID=2997341 RepID=A0ABT4J838_9RHOB|nr:acyl-CoA dehydrogenase family protein [Paracoccus sp. EF6]MCZ0963242.1 acyl-CoA dehydrogenase family protein [Paracoccus sp. EF6]
MTHQDRKPPEAASARITTHDQALAAARILAHDWATRAAQRDAQRFLPHAEMQAFSDSGLGAITVPVAYGGPGLAGARWSRCSRSCAPPTARPGRCRRTISGSCTCCPK